MKRKVIVTLLVTLFLGATALADVKPDLSLRLYPDGQKAKTGLAGGPGESNGLSGKYNEIHPHVFEDVADPFIEIFLPKKCNGQMLIICPGGGYKNVWARHEGVLVAEWALKRNIAACVVVYRQPNHHSNVPLTDVQNAFRYCRSKAEEWGVNQIGVVGFSAGGHLAASASTLYTDQETRPDFSVLIYPVITMESATHGGSRRNLLGENPTREQIEYYSTEKRITPNTPPAFIALSRDDKTVAPENSIQYYRSLVANCVSGELHIYTKGGHGWGFGGRFEGDEDGLGDQRKDFDIALERWLKYIKK